MAKAPNQTNKSTGTSRDDTTSAQEPAGGWLNRLGQGPAGDWLSRLGQVLAPRPPVADVSTLNGKRGASNGATNQAAEPKRSPWDPRPKSQMGKLIFGMLIYFLGSQLLEFGLALVFNWFKLSLTAKQALFPASTWIIGGLTNFSLIYFVLIALFVWALFRFNVIPRDFLRPASQQRGSARGGPGANQGATNGTSATTGVSNASRHSGRQRLVMTAPTTKPKRSATSTLRSKPSTSVVKAAAPRANGKAAPVPPSADESYERVKSLQRARRRKR